jgi:hypothetical protein
VWTAPARDQFGDRFFHLVEPGEREVRVGVIASEGGAFRFDRVRRALSSASTVVP